MKALRKNRVEVAAIVGLLLIACVVGGYIMVHQRLALPWNKTYDISARFISAQAVTPGQGQEVAVAGVPVGQISDVSLDDGVAVVRMTIQRSKLDAVHADAAAFLRPKTPLQDMQVQLDPGSAKARVLADGAVLPERATTPQVQLDQVLSNLDADTRAFVATTINSFGTGLRNRGPDLRRLLGSFGPTLASAREVTDAVNARRADLRRLIAALRSLTSKLGPQQNDIGRLIRSAEKTFSAVGNENAALGAALDDLPATLRATRVALDRTRPLARVLPRAADRLGPVLRDFAPALRGVRPLLQTGGPDLDTLKRFMVAARPLAREARPALASLRAQTPDLARVFGVTEELTNELAYNPDGPEEGFLFWLAWFSHNVQSVLSTGDANGAVWHGMLAVSCATPAVYPSGLPAAVGALFELTRACPKDVR